MANVKGILVEIGGDTSGLQKALQKVNSASSSLSKELKGINSLLKLDPKNTELVAQKQKVLKDEISKTEGKLKLLKEAQKQADETIKNGGEISQENYRKLQREIISTESKLREFKLEASNWTKAGKSVEDFGNKVIKISEKVNSIGTNFSKKITLPVVAVATGIMKISGDFDSSMKQVAATMGITREEIEKGSTEYKILEQAAQKCGETTKYSATEAAEALNYLALAGYNAEQSARLLPKVLNLAAAGNLELATATDMVTDAMSALGMEEKDVDKYIDEMAKTSQKSNTSVQQLGEATLTCAGTVKLANMTLETMNAELGILANNGIKGAEGGTHLRNIILSLTSPTDSAAKAIKGLGINVTDSSGQIRDLNDIMKDFNAKMDKMSDSKKTDIISKIFNKTDISAVNALIKGSGEEFSKLKKEISKCDGAAQNMADTMNSSLEGEMTLLKSQIEGISIKFGNKMMPTIKKVVKGISNLADRFSKLSDEQVETIIKIAALVAAIGPAIKIIGTLGKGVGTVTKTIGILSQAIGVMNSGAASSSKSVNTLAGVLNKIITPAGMVTVAIMAAAGAYTYFTAKQKEAEREFREFEDSVNSAKENQDNWIKSIDDSTGTELAHLDRIKNLKDELLNLVDENGRVNDSDKERAQFILNELNEALGTEYDMNNNVIDSIDDLKGATDDLILKKKADIVMASEAKKWEQAYNDQTDAIEKQEAAWQQILDAAGLMGDSVDTYIKNVAQAKKDWDNFQNNNGPHTELMERYNKAVVDQADQLINTYNTATERVKKDTEIMNSYDQKMAEYKEKNYDAIVNTVKKSTDNYTNYSVQKLKESIQTESNALDKHKKVFESTQNDKAKTLMESSENTIKLMADELRARTSTIESLGEEEKAAWKSLAEGNYNIYEEQLVKMSPAMAKNIQDATGVIINESPVMVDMTKRMSERVVEQLDCNEEFRQKALTDLYGFLNGLSDETLRDLLQTAGVEDVERVIKGIKEGNLAESEGVDILKKLDAGLQNTSFKDTLFATAKGIASTLSKLLNVTGSVQVDTSSQKHLFSSLRLPGHKSGLDYVPFDNYIARLHKGERVLTAEENEAFTEAENQRLKLPKVKDFGKLQKTLSNQISNCTNSYNINLNFYPKTMSNAELNNAYNFFNKKIGKQY